jgi:Mrp family chromosome partitioning ATPase
VSPEGVESLKLVARRSVWIVVVLIAVGAALMTLARQAQGARYEATARVVLSPIDLASALAGFQGFVDPDTLDDTEKVLANSRQLFVRAAQETGGSLGSASELRAATVVSKDDATVTFTAVGSDPEVVVRTANAVANTYPEWRADVSGAAIDRAMTKLEQQIERGGRDAGLEEELNRLEVIRTLTSGNVLLVEVARRATQTRPSLVRDAIVGAFIGFFVSLLAVAAREAIDTRVRSEAEVEDLLNVPVVGTIETLPRRAPLVALGRQHQRYGDMYALLAASLARSSDSRAKLIAVTSATAEEGKTTTASNLAVALARRNSDVTLVDLDSRKPSLGKLFKIHPTAPGIEEVVRGEVTPHHAIWRVSLNGRGVLAPRSSFELDASEGGTLRVLPMRPTNRVDVMRSADLRSTLVALGEESQYVVIDTPPALAVPDVTEIAQFVDMVLIVVRHGRVSQRSLTALGRLHRNWPDVQLAAVLVGTPRGEDAYAYYALG